MKATVFVLAILAAGSLGLVLYLSGPQEVFISMGEGKGEVVQAGLKAVSRGGENATQETSTPSEPSLSSSNKNADIENQPPLPNPPSEVKGIYVTAWVAGSEGRMNALIDLIDKTELNAVIIDVKDYSGYVSYFVDNDLVKNSGALDEPRILRPNALIKKLHDRDIYTIARITIFQDSVLAKSHPEWALRNGSSSKLWLDRKGLAWMDPSSKDVWNYNIIIAKDALARGFDEVNFDYIRFPSDGNLETISYPAWDGVRDKYLVIRDFFQYLREKLGEAKLSADLFGLVTVSADDLGIGQTLNSALPFFDFVAPMTYPSHYAAGSFGYGNPAEFPYEVLKNSMVGALAKIKKYEYGLAMNVTSSSENVSGTASEVRLREARAKIRPWLQDFDLGADYDAEKVRAQMKATEDWLGDGYVGWMLWDPKNVYTKEALLGVED